ncbi:hypothetical protein LTR84_008967 [Exophiala bonariae]|uniref:TAXI family TRAP transporter solute receptor n=1 Tax=Exophiala bonariae TaxID=1690606 RepID=A0AAV9MVF0_9EURO|nr:hypothetical protein LTR84_008967 [Exophiala bonariae]
MTSVSFTAKGQATRTMIQGSPKIARSVQLSCVGDWGQANWHKIMSWITQEFCERCGPQSRTCIWSVRGGGMDSITMVDSGEAQIAITTPAAILATALNGTGFFADQAPMPGLRGLAVIPQNDRLVLGLDPSLGCKTFADIRAKKPKMKFAIGPDGDSQIGWLAHRYLEAHDISVNDIREWGGEVVFANRPEECLLPCHDISQGFTAVLQEALTTPWWGELVDGERKFIPIPGEPEALDKMTPSGISPRPLPPGWWKNQPDELPAIDFSDFVVFCREDLPDDVAHLLAWIMTETKIVLERQFHSFPGDRSPVGWPMDPKKMAKTTIPLHPGAERYYRENGYL